MNIQQKNVKAEERRSATLSSKFQISIPKAVREAQGWQVGQRFSFLPIDGTIKLVPIPTLNEIRGIARGADKSGYRDRDDGA